MANFRSGYLDQGSPLGMAVKEANLIADNQRVDCSGIQFLKLSSNSTTASQRTFVLNSSTQVGQTLFIEFVSGASTTCELADSGTCKLSATWSPTQYDAITLVSDGTYWIEQSRAMAAALPNVALTDGHIFVGSASNLAADVAVSGDITMINTGAATIANLAVTTAKINTAGVTLAKLAAGITPSHVVKYGAVFTTVGGSATEAITVAGVAATDLVFVTVRDNGTNNVTLLTAIPTTNTITVTFSGDPAADTIINYTVFRAAS